MQVFKDVRKILWKSCGKAHSVKNLKGLKRVFKIMLRLYFHVKHQFENQSKMNLNRIQIPCTM